MGATDDDADIDIAKLFGAIRARRVFILLAVVAAGLAAYGITASMTPLYRGEASILIESHGARAAIDPRRVSSQVQVLQSAGLIRTVAKQLDLADRKEFGDGRPSLVHRLFGALGLAGAGPMPADQRVLERFRDRLDVHAASGSHIIIRFSSRDPKFAADAANAMASAYVLHQSGPTPAANSNAAARHGPEIAKLRKEVSEAESKVTAYRSRAEFAADNTGTPISRQLTAMASELDKVRTQKIDAEARVSSLRAALKQGRGVDTLANVAASPLVRQLRQQEVAARAKLAGLSTTLGSRHPRILALQAQIDELGRRITAESRKALDNLEDEASAAARREQDLSGQMKKLKASSGGTGNQPGRLQALQHDASAARAQLDAHLARYGEADSGGSHNGPRADARIVSSAVPPALPYFPKTVPIVIGAMLAAFLLSCGGVMLRELFAGQARRRTGPPPAHAVTSAPAIRAAAKTPENRPVENDDGSERAPDRSPLPDTPDAAPANDSHDGMPEEIVASRADEDDFSIAAAAARLIDDDDGAVVICVSPEGDESAAACVILARLLAEQDIRTVLVDMTGSAGPTYLMTGHDNPAGITDLLSGRIGFAEAIHGDRLSPAHIVPRGISDPQSTMNAAARLPAILDGLGATYDVVLVECGPTDAATVSRLMHEGTRHRLIVTAVEPGADTVADTLAEFYGAGYEDPIVILTAAPESQSQDENRAVAA